MNMLEHRLQEVTYELTQVNREIEPVRYNQLVLVRNEILKELVSD